MAKKLLWGMGLASVLLAFAVGFAFFSVNGGFSANYYEKKGLQYLEAGDTDRAAQLLELALRSDPGRTESRIRLAGLYRAEGEGDKAEALLEDGIRLAGQSSSCWLELARLYVSQGRLEAAAKLLDTPAEGYLGLTIGQRRPRVHLSRVTGTYGAPLRVTVNQQQGTVCYYTLDGTVPDLSSPVWPGELELEAGEYTLTLVAVREDLPSPVIRARYTVTDSLPAFAPAGEQLENLILYLQALEAVLAEHGYYQP